MEITVTIEKILEPQSFDKKDGTKMVRNSFVGKNNGQYPKSVKFDVLKPETFEKMRLAVGFEYIVSFDVESREWNGRWYTSLNAWKATSTNGTQSSNVGAHPQPQVSNNNPTHAAPAADPNDIPF